MSLETFYNEVSNPLDNREFLDTVINAYLNTTRTKGFYGRLVKSHSNEKQYPNEFVMSDKDELYSLLFNEWKNRIVNMSKNEFDYLCRKGYLGNSFPVLRYYLKNIPDVSTYEEVDRILHSRYNDKVLDSAMDTYRFTAFGEGSTWNHISSNKISVEKDSFFPIYHRLYLNTEGIDTYKIVAEFTKKCLERNLPYYYKFTEYADREDNIVVYSDTEHLYDYIEILREIKREQQQIRTLKPPFMSGSIDGWIGYGSEPERKPDGSLQSFNGKRADMLERNIKEAAFRWLDRNKNTNVKKHGKTKNIKDYFADKCAFFLMEDLKERYKRLMNHYSEEELTHMLGYSLSDLDNPIVRRNISHEIAIRMNDIRNTDDVSVEMEVRDGKTIKFNKYHLQDAIKRLIEVIRPGRGEEFKSILMDEIIETSSLNNISRNNFAFDLTGIKRINKEITRRDQEARRRKMNNNIYNLTRRNIIQDDLNSMFGEQTEDFDPYKTK